MISVQSDALRIALKQVAWAVPKKPTIPSLGYVLFACKDNHLDLVAANHEVSVRYEVLGPGTFPDFQILLPPDRLKIVLEGARADQIEFTVGATDVRVICGHSRFSWPLADPQLFPAHPWMDESDGYQVLASEFRTLLKRTGFAGDLNSTRYALGGVCLALGKDAILGVTTDGRRMSLQSIRGVADNPLGDEVPRPLLPIRSARDLEPLLANDEHADILFHLNERQEPVGIEVHCGLCSFHSRLVEGHFPDWKVVQARSHPDCRVTVQVAELLWLVRQGALGTNEESNGIKLILNEDKIVATAEASDVGSACAEIPIEEFEGHWCQFSLGRDYLKELLEVLDGDTRLRLGYTEETGCAEFTIPDAHFTHYIFAMNRPETP